MTKKQKQNKVDMLEYLKDQNEIDLDFFNDYDNDIITTSNLKKYKKQVEKYCFTISLGCMLKIGLLLVGNFILFLIKLYIYITYC